MKSLHFHPPGRTAIQAQDLVRLPSACLAQSAKDLRFKRLTGWRGLAPCPGGEAFTCRLASRPGIYGLALESTLDASDQISARFHLYYFPEPEEALADKFSLAAGCFTATPEYRAMCREFPRHQTMAGLFFAGSLDISMLPDGQAVALRLLADTTRRTIALDGVRTDQGEWVIEPGHPDEDLPAFDLCRDPFRTLCAAVTFCAGEPPVGFSCAHTPSLERRYKADGTFTLHPFPASPPEKASASCQTAHCLVWGDRVRLNTWADPTRGWTAGFCLTTDDSRLPGDLKDTPDGGIYGLHNDLCWTMHDLPAMQASGKHRAAFDERPRLVVLSGFLGSGKTTFLNQFMEYHMARDQFVAVIQNEVGETGVDAALLEGDDSVVEMDEGCVCCTLAGNLAGAVNQLTTRYRPEVIVLESTGLANPLNLLREIDSLAHMVRLDAIVTLVDAEHAADVLKSCEIAREQIRGADAMVLNKCDLATPEQMRRLRKKLAALNSQAPMLEAVQGRVNFGMLFDTHVEEAPPLLIPHMPQPSPPHHAHHGRHTTHQNEGFSSLRIALKETVDPAELFAVLDRCRSKAFRIKGIFNSADDGKPWVLQYVGGRYEISPLGGTFEDAPFVVLIGQDLDVEELHSLWLPLTPKTTEPAKVTA